LGSREVARAVVGRGIRRGPFQPQPQQRELLGEAVVELAGQP
jgi:hypothetical protein